MKAFAESNDISQSLDTQFWIWERIEESIRGEIETMSDDDYYAVYHGFAVNFKGSRELHDSFEQRNTRAFAELFPQEKK